MSSPEDRPLKSARRKWIMLCAKLAILGLVVWGVRRSLSGGIEQLREHPISIDYRWLVVAGGVYLLGMLPSGFFWYRILHRLDQRPRLGETLRAYYIGHLGKYVPGKALVVILRTGLIRSRRVDATLAAVSVFLETLTMMAVGALVAAILLGLLFRDQWQNVLLALVMAVGAGVPTLPRVFRFLVGRMGITKFNPDVLKKLQNIDLRLMAIGWVGIAFGWFLLGLSLWATLRAMGLHGDSASDLALLTATVALAMVGGFLSLIPGGLGVRDALVIHLVMLYLSHAGASPANLTAADTPQAHAIVAAVLLRIVWLVAELLIAGVVYVAGMSFTSSRQ